MCMFVGAMSLYYIVFGTSLNCSQTGQGCKTLTRKPFEKVDRERKVTNVARIMQKRRLLRSGSRETCT